MLSGELVIDIIFKLYLIFILYLKYIELKYIFVNPEFKK